MELKIGNLLAGVILMFTLWFFLEWQVEVMDCISCVMKTGPGNPPVDRLKGCVALGFLILGLVSVISLILSERGKK